jgi:hypothetical protein
MKQSPNFFEEGSNYGIDLLLLDPVHFWPFGGYQFQNFISAQQFL